MIRKFSMDDGGEVMRIWLAANVQAHGFIPESYWMGNYDAVKAMLPLAAVYVSEDSARILGFIWMTGDYIDGLFVDGDARSKGVGAQLLNLAKQLNDRLRLNVYRKNERAVRFYLRENFTVRALSRDQDTGETELLPAWPEWLNSPRGSLG